MCAGSYEIHAWISLHINHIRKLWFSIFYSDVNIFNKVLLWNTCEHETVPKKKSKLAKNTRKIRVSNSEQEFDKLNSKSRKIGISRKTGDSTDRGGMRGMTGQRGVEISLLTPLGQLPAWPLTLTSQLDCTHCRQWEWKNGKKITTHWVCYYVLPWSIVVTHRSTG